MTNYCRKRNFFYQYLCSYNNATNKVHKFMEHSKTHLLFNFSNTFQPSQTIFRGRGKGKVHPRTGHKGPEGKKRYSSAFSLTLALDGTPGKDPVPIV
jgi:hypothetical protein